MEVEVLRKIYFIFFSFIFNGGRKIIYIFFVRRKRMRDLSLSLSLILCVSACTSFDELATRLRPSLAPLNAKCFILFQIPLSQRPKRPHPSSLCTALPPILFILYIKYFLLLQINLIVLLFYKFDFPLPSLFF